MCREQQTAVSSSKARDNLSILSANRPSNATILRFLYMATTFLCGLMVFWILVFPATWFIEHSNFHQSIIQQKFDRGDQVVSADLMTKYKGHWAIHFTHILPGVIWSAAIPLQLHPGLRQRHRVLHRVVGYLFMATSLVMMVGLGIIIKRDLTFENFYPDLPPPKQESTPGMIAMGIWYLVTAIVATVQARRRQFRSHRRFIIRHVASGIWVSLQRVLILTVYNRPPLTRMQQRAVFGNAALTAVVISVACGELAIYLLDQEYKKTKHE